MIDVKELYKEFKVFQRPDGVWASVKSIFHREYSIIKAVNGVSFHIDNGEIVGYVGMNGAGKSTTIKMLSGILVPSSGSLTVNGIIPYKNRVANAKNIGVVFGQRSQLYWDLPVIDSFMLHKRLYDIPNDVYAENVKHFTDILQLGNFIHQPVRQLSLGQKMRANIAISLIHNPPVVFLDEPTIGLDIVAKAAIRDFILEINKQRGTTFILTTHDMNDIEHVCQRLILIDKGEIRYDGSLNNFKQSYGEKYILTCQIKEFKAVPQSELFYIEEKTDEKKILLFGDKSKISVSDAVNYVMKAYEVVDISIQESNIESILRQIFTQ
ncbi:MAG: ATP-binding cassette domain-containing protein [Clostridiales bacterium]|jgi:ABC-2 type transport system ATP-binding protein|nr:ATP-binding cassette domain-containing protein [Clostridiales bacterium]